MAPADALKVTPHDVTGLVDGTVVTAAVTKLTRIAIELHGPTTIDLARGPQEITRLRCYADDPAAFVARARATLDVCCRAQRG